MIKNLNFWLLLLLGATIALSCSSDDDSSDDNNDMDMDPDRSGFLGTWDVEEDCDPSGVYKLVITEGMAGDEIILENVTQKVSEVTLTATVDDAQSFTIPSQSDASITYSGSGTVNGDNIDIDLTIVDVIGSNSCNITGLKEGATPPDATRADYVGDWDGSQQCDGSTLALGIEIEAGTEEDEIVIKNFYSSVIGSIDEVTATINGNSFTIPEQSEGGDLSVMGSGTISATTANYDMISITYEISSDIVGDVVDDCTYTATKQ